MRNAECGIAGQVRSAGLAPGIELALQFRTPHSAFRILLVGALAACGSSDGPRVTVTIPPGTSLDAAVDSLAANHVIAHPGTFRLRSEEHTSELQSRLHLVCRLLLEKKKQQHN